MQRIFVIGCPRSGTTLVQALLARHPTVLTLPETAFFERLYGDLNWRWGDHGARPRRPRSRQRLGLAPRHMHDALQVLRSGVSAKSRWRLLPRRADRYARCFVDILDERARLAGRAMWAEKTPNHLLYISEIERLVPNARFVHVIRAGEDVLASIADANMRFENNNAFGGGTVHWMRRWNRAAQIHRGCIGQPHHHFILLEDLILDTECERRRLCAFLDLDPEIDLDVSNVQMIADLAAEPWKHEAIHGRPAHTEGKANSVFGPQMRDWLCKRLASYRDLRQACMTHAENQSRNA